MFGFHHKVVQKALNSLKRVETSENGSLPSREELKVW